MLSPNGMIRAAASTGATKVKVPMRAKITAEVRKNIFAGAILARPGESWSLAELEDPDQGGVLIQEFVALRESSIRPRPSYSGIFVVGYHGSWGIPAMMATGR